MSRRSRARLPEEILEAEIDALSHDGRGVGRVDGKTVFVRDALPGEHVRFRLTRRKKNFDEGVLVELLRAAPDRVEPGCAHFGVCGGCSLQHLDRASQVAHKQRGLIEALEHIGKVEADVLDEPLVSEPWGYRRKARLGVKFVRKHERVFAGFRERGTSFVTDVRECRVLHPRVGPLTGDLADMIGSLSIRDKVPQVEMAMGDDLCAMVFRVLAPPTEEDRTRIAAFCSAHNWVPCIQEGGPDSVRALDGSALDIHYSLPEQGVHFTFLPTDFTQVNLEMNRRMVTQALDWLAPEEGERILDLFCGLGNFSLPIARKCEAVVGVEGDGALVARARKNAEDNAIHNTRFYAADLYGELDAEPWMRERFDAVLLDPPRSGAAEMVPLIPKLGAERILYVSCYPGTLARDAGMLVNEHGYRLVRAGIMDMFPHTAHVESMALLVRGG